MLSNVKYLKILLGVSLLVNLILLTGLVFGAYHFRERIVQAWLNWSGKAKIVFYGDSITAQGQWNVLMRRCDIRNSAIPGLGVVHLKDDLEKAVLSFQPELCVFMGGINDLTILERSVEETIEDYKSLLLQLKNAQLKTLVQLTLYERESPSTKVKVERLNEWLIAFCDSLNIPVVDPNRWLSDHSGLQKGLAGDRTHLTSEAYAQWATQLQPILETELK